MWLDFLPLSFLVVVVFGFDCPPGSTPIPNESLCMYPASQPQFYQDATWECNSMGGTVAKVTNAFENSYFFSMASLYFNQTDQWIGVQKLANGTWVYADRSALSYQNWAADEPRNATGYNCAILTSYGLQWSAADCSLSRPNFCVLPPQPTTTTTTPAPHIYCPSGWTYFEKTSSCYIVYDLNSKMSFSDAESYCRGVGAHLASIHSSVEDDFIYNLIPRLTVSSCSESEYVWLGLDNGNGKIGSGKWTDGTPVDYGVGDLGGTGYLGAPKVSDGSGYCTNKRYDWYSTWLSHNFYRLVCKKRAN